MVGWLVGHGVRVRVDGWVGRLVVSGKFEDFLALHSRNIKYGVLSFRDFLSTGYLCGIFGKTPRRR
jgi:hypothetical protein